MKLKTDESGNAVLQEGMPVYIYDDGREAPFDAPRAVATIKTTGDERDGLRDQVKEKDRALEPWKAIGDPEKAKKALETLANLDAGKLKDASEVERIKTEAQALLKQQLLDAEAAHKRVQDDHAKTLAAKDMKLRDLTLSHRFAASKFVTEKLVGSPRATRAAFDPNFEVNDDGQIVAYKVVAGKREPIFSKKNPGSYADFDESIEELVLSDPDKDKWLRGSGASGGGADQQPRAGAIDGKTSATREQFDSWTPAKRSEFSKSGGQIVAGA